MIENPAGASAHETADACGRNVAGRPSAAGRCLLLPRTSSAMAVCVITVASACGGRIFLIL
jgi:hypothetical protein